MLHLVTPGVKALRRSLAGQPPLDDDEEDDQDDGNAPLHGGSSDSEEDGYPSMEKMFEKVMRQANGDGESSEGDDSEAEMPAEVAEEMLKEVRKVKRWTEEAAAEFMAENFCDRMQQHHKVRLFGIFVAHWKPIAIRSFLMAMADNDMDDLASCLATFVASEDSATNSDDPNKAGELFTIYGTGVEGLGKVAQLINQWQSGMKRDHFISLISSCTSNWFVSLDENSYAHFLEVLLSNRDIWSVHSACELLRTLQTDENWDEDMTAEIAFFAKITKRWPTDLKKQFVEHVANQWGGVWTKAKVGELRDSLLGNNSNQQQEQQQSQPQQPSKAQSQANPSTSATASSETAGGKKKKKKKKKKTVTTEAAPTAPAAAQGQKQQTSSKKNSNINSNGKLNSNNTKKGNKNQQQQNNAADEETNDSDDVSGIDVNHVLDLMEKMSQQTGEDSEFDKEDRKAYDLFVQTGEISPAFLEKHGFFTDLD